MTITQSGRARPIQTPHKTVSQACLRVVSIPLPTAALRRCDPPVEAVRRRLSLDDLRQVQ